MKNFVLKYILLVLIAVLQGCNLFSPVDPLPPAFSKLELVDVKRNEITVSGTISNPDADNDRQEKKSGEIQEYGIVYGTSANLDIEKNSVRKLGDKPSSLPIAVQNQKLTGLTADTQYYIALYARNEGGGIGYSEVLNVKTTVLPAITATRTSVKVTRSSGSLWYDFDAGRVAAVGDPQTDVTIDWFSITGRGTTISITATGGVALKNLGATTYDKLTYLDLVKIPDYSNANVSFLLTSTTTNSVIVFKTKEGRYGKWRIESISGNDMIMSLIAYEN
jgi:hypothetical protein